MSVLRFITRIVWSKRWFCHVLRWWYVFSNSLKIVMVSLHRESSSLRRRILTIVFDFVGVCFVLLHLVSMIISQICWIQHVSRDNVLCWCCSNIYFSPCAWLRTALLS